MDIELKTALENSNRLIEALRTDQKADADRVARMEADLAKSLEAKSALEARIADIETKNARPGNFGQVEKADEHKAAFVDFLRDPQNSAARNRVETEQKAANVVVNGGNGIAIPRQIADAVLKQLVNESPIRGLATVITVSTTDYVEMLDLANAGTTWVNETAVRGTTAAPDLVQIKPVFGEQHATIEVSNHAIQDASFGLESWLSSSLAERFAAGENLAFVSGDGVNKPLGLLSAGAGFEEIVSGAAADLGVNPHDRIVDLMYGVRAGYRANASFLMNSATLAGFVKIKDANGSYIYTPSIAAGMSDTILGKRVAIVEDMPSIAAGSTPVAFGDIARAYLIADRVGMSIIVDPYTKAGFVKFTASKRVGGTPRDPMALRLLRIGA